jgi:hypothetical protein
VVCQNGSVTQDECAAITPVFVPLLFKCMLRAEVRWFPWTASRSLWSVFGVLLSQDSLDVGDQPELIDVADKCLGHLLDVSVLVLGPSKLGGDENSLVCDTNVCRNVGMWFWLPSLR